MNACARVPPSPQRECRKYSIAHVLGQIRQRRGDAAADNVWRHIKETAANTLITAYADSVSDKSYVLLLGVQLPPCR